MSTMTAQAQSTSIRWRAVPLAVGCLVLALIACNLSAAPTGTPARALPTLTAAAAATASNAAPTATGAPAATLAPSATPPPAATAGFNSYIAFSRTSRTGFAAACNGHNVTQLLAPQINTMLGASVIESDDTL